MLKVINTLRLWVTKPKVSENKLQVGSQIAYCVNKWKLATVVDITKAGLWLDNGRFISHSIKKSFPVPTCLLEKFYQDKDGSSLKEEIEQLEEHIL